MKTKTIKCIECGCEVVTNIHSSRAKYCKPCKKIIERNRIYERHHKPQAENKPEPVNIKPNLSECIKQATKLNVSYGSYMAMLREENAKT